MRVSRILLLTAIACRAWAAEGNGAFPIRGTLPWHNFLSGPTAWNEADWSRYLDWMRERGLNLLALHCYTGGGQRYVSYVEPMIRMEYRGVLPEARFDTSLTARWGYRPLAVRDFAFHTAKLFGPGAAYGSDAALAASDNEDRYRRAQALIRRVFEMAHQRGIQVGMGFEFGVYPPELFSIVPQDSYLRSMVADPTHPASQEILRLTIDDILRAYPGIDWIWLWLQELETPVGAARLSSGMEKLMRESANRFAGSTANGAFTGTWSLAYIRAAHAYLRQRAPKVRIAVSGWGGAAQLTGILAGLDKGLPEDIVFTCLNPAQGASPQPPVLEEIAKHRQVWVMPWLEGDAKLWHPQPRVNLLAQQMRRASQSGEQGAVAIHWRTRDIRENMEAFAEFARNPEAADASRFYGAYVQQQYGPSASALTADLLSMDSGRWFESMKSPEYSPYDPTWGQMKPEDRQRIQKITVLVEAAREAAPDPRFRNNLDWLAAKLRFTLLLDEVSAGMEPAYRLHERGEGDRTAARHALEAAPVEALFQTYARSVRSRGELGVLSSLNQRLWLQYEELRKLLGSH
jgi:hypothetical protein